MNARHVAACVAALAFVWCAPAHAQWSAASDVSVVVPNSAWDAELAPDLRLGYRFGLPRSLHFHSLIFRPELTVGYLYLSAHDAARADVEKLRFGGGIRAGGFIKWVELYGMAHLRGAAGHGDLQALWDWGGSLEYRLSRMNLGVHAMKVWFPGAPAWCELGLHYEYHWFW
jgi:hypothetical protein